MKNVYWNIAVRWHGNCSTNRKRKVHHRWIDSYLAGKPYTRIFNSTQMLTLNVISVVRSLRWPLMNIGTLLELPKRIAKFAKLTNDKFRTTEWVLLMTNWANDASTFFDMHEYATIVCPAVLWLCECTISQHVPKIVFIVDCIACPCTIWSIRMTEQNQPKKTSRFCWK